MAVTSNPKVRGLSLMLVVTLAVLCTAPTAKTTHIDAGKEYTLMMGGEQLRFTAWPELGYVVKTRHDTASIDALDGMLKDVGAVNITPICGLGRKGICVVYGEQSAAENERTVRLLRSRSEVQYAAPLFSSSGDTVAIIPEIVVRVKPGTNVEQVQRLCEAAGCAINKRMEFTEQEYLVAVLGPNAEAVFAAVEQLSQAPCVEWACPNTAFQPKLCGRDDAHARASGEPVWFGAPYQDANSPGVLPNDEYFPRQWHLHNTGQLGLTPDADINGPEAWEITTGDPNIVVAVLDSGVDVNHPDLIGNLVPGYDFFEGDDDPSPASGTGDAHGTMCAGFIAAGGNNYIGVTGVTWRCRIMPIRLFKWVRDEETYGVVDMCTAADVATAFRWAASKGADALSNSWGWSTNPTPIFHSAIVDITKANGIGRSGKGCLMLFAAGNDSVPLREYPQKYPEVITVGATNHDDVRCSYSNYGPELDITAPGGEGVELWTTDISGSAGKNTPFDSKVLDYTSGVGTSFASPIAAGVAALILSIEPNLTNEEMRHFLERSAKDLGDPGRDDYCGWGRVDARAALDMVLAKRCDLNNDWKVDEDDQAILMKAMETNDLSADIAPAAKRDGVVDANDLELLTRYLGTAIPELGLIAHWTLDETEGAVAHNATGDPAYNAALYGNPSWQPEGGKVGGALQFSGAGDYVKTPFVRDPSQGAFSVFAWIKGGAPGQVILSQETGTDWLLADASQGFLMTELKYGGRGKATLCSQTVITDGNWHRVGLTWDGSNRVLYVDDVEVARDTQPDLVASAGGLYIGAGSSLAAGSFWFGLIDDVRIYDRAVTP